VSPRILAGGLILLISTPWRQTGLLWDLYTKEHGRSKSAVVLQGSTRIMRPDKSQQDIDDEYERDPESARAELGAEFLENVSALLPPADLEAAIDRGVTRKQPMEDPRWRYLAAMDPSGLRNDSWAFTVLGGKGDDVVQFVSRGWYPGTPVERIVEEIKAELGRFRLSSVYTDQYGSEITASLFTGAGIRVHERPFTAGASSPKALGFKALKEMILSQRIMLLDDPIQTKELRLLEVTRLSGGGERIAAPGRLHDDRACALALAMSEVRPGSERCAVTVQVIKPTRWHKQNDPRFMEL
jgi:hypothetical protein